MTLKKVKKTRLTTLTKCLIGNYHNGFNNEHAKHVLEKVLIVNSLLGYIPIAPKQAVGMKGLLQIPYT